RLRVSSKGEIALESARLTLRGLAPVFNGVRLDGAQTGVRADQPDALDLRLTAPGLGGAALDVTLRRRDAHAWEMRYALVGDPGAPVDSFGVCFGAVENLRAYLQNGTYSWDGSRYVEPGEDTPQPGYAMTQLLPREGAGSVVLGFDRHDRFQHTFRVEVAGGAPSLAVETVWD